MAQSIAAPSLRIPVEPLTQASFASFGTVIDTSKSASLRDSGSVTASLTPVTANQGTALKYANITPLTNFYGRSRSKTPSNPTASLFVCKPRQLDPVSNSSSPSTPPSEHLFRVSIFERHPFTSQTFIPLGHSPTTTNDTTSSTPSSYLIIVAPTLPLATLTKARTLLSAYPTEKPKPTRARALRALFASSRPAPFTNSAQAPDPTTTLTAMPDVHAVHRHPAGPGMPDVQRLRAFVASGDQAVTYAAGVWHAPMAVLGAGEMAFVVVQHVSGVGEEDCQEVELVAEGVERGVSVVIGGEGTVESGRVKSKL
ncbi:MAG: Ureidoglycolate lyase [Bathelium mastoideum]|nr:MAG: Ureidoglycolate lyase [Bathelium mastoideum]